MARILNALQLALGGVGAGVSSYGRSMIDREERLRREAQQEEMNAINALNMFRAAGGGITLAGGRPVSAAMQESFALPEAKLPAPTMAPSAIGQAFTRATQADMGVSPRPTGLLDTPIQLALETAPRRVTTPAAPVTPRRTMKAGGMEFELKSAEEMAQEKQALENAQFESALQALSPEERAKIEPIARAARLGTPANVLQQVYGQPQQKASRLQLNEKTGQIINLDTGEATSVKGFIQPPKEGKTDSDKPKFGEVASLRKEFNTESRPYKTINDALRNIETLGTKPNPTPQDLQALVYQFVKVQDPTSVVRESEYANAANAAALIDKIGNYANRVANGQTLSPKQRADMVQTARLLRVEAMNQYSQLANSYEELAGSFGMDPKTIVPNRLDRGTATSAKPSGKTLEQEFPERKEQIQMARSSGYTDAQIRARLTGGK
jgi:hypothetical protein